MEELARMAELASGWLATRSSLDFLVILGAVLAAVWGGAKTVWAVGRQAAGQLARGGKALLSWWRRPSRLDRIERKLSDLAQPLVSTIQSEALPLCPACHQTLKTAIRYGGIGGNMKCLHCSQLLQVWFDSGAQLRVEKCME